MKDLEKLLKENSVELLIWDVDRTIFTLEWDYNGNTAQLLKDIYNSIISIDPSLILDKNEFINRKFPYPEINAIGIKHGKETQDRVKEIFRQKELEAIDYALPNNRVIEFIKECDLPQTIWSNNMSSTILHLLSKYHIDSKISAISSLDRVIMSKPDIEGFTIIQDAFPDISPQRMLFIGDSIRSDKAAADKAGTLFYHLSDL